MSFSQVRNIKELFKPAGGVDSMWSGSFATESFGWSLPMLTVQPNVTVEEVSFFCSMLPRVGEFVLVSDQLRAVLGEILFHFGLNHGWHHSILLHVSQCR